jgi:excisionase family DNA binding protein
MSIQFVNFSIQEFKTLVIEVIREELKKLPTPPTPDPEVELMTRKEAAAFLLISLPTLNKLVKQGVIKRKTLGSLIRFEKVELEKAFTQLKKKGGRNNEQH